MKLLVVLIKGTVLSEPLLIRAERVKFENNKKVVRWNAPKISFRVTIHVPASRTVHLAAQAVRVSFARDVMLRPIKTIWPVLPTPKVSTFPAFLPVHQETQSAQLIVTELIMKI